MNKKAYFISQLEEIAAERMTNIEEFFSDDIGYEFNGKFRHKDFKIQFCCASDLEKHLGRQAKNRLKKLAGFVELYGSITRNYTKSKKVDADKDIQMRGEAFQDIFDIDKHDVDNKKSLSNYLTSIPICPYVIKVDYTDVPTILFISHKNGPLLKIYRTQSIVQNVIEYAKECGLIQCVSESYTNRHNGPYSKKYAWNKVCEHQLRELIKKHGIVYPATHLNQYTEPVFNEHEVEDIELYYKICFANGMMTPNVTHEKVVSILSDKYQPLLKPIYERNNFYNEGRSIEQQFKFEIHTHISPKGFNTKNGGRTTALCSNFKNTRPKDDNAEVVEDVDYTGIYFDEYFKENFGEEYTEIDVKGSVPRITRFVNKGIWDDVDIDPYAKMFPNVKRHLAKSIYMPYQFEHTGMSFVNHVALKVPNYLESHDRDDIRQTLEYYTDMVYEYQGKSLGNLVFLCEDGIYSKVDVELKKKGYEFIRKYDAWFFKKSKCPSREYLNKMIAKNAKDWFKSEWKKQKAVLDIFDIYGIKELKKLLGRIDNKKSLSNYLTSIPICPYVIKVDSDKKMKFKAYKKQLKSTQKVKIENSDIPEEQSNTLSIKILQQLKNDVVIARLSISKANSICKALGFSTQFSLQDQPFGFTATSRTMKTSKLWDKLLPTLKDLIR